jgi:hypothetical protein
LQSLVDRGELLPCLVEECGRVLPLEGERGALRVVLVVGPVRAGGLGDVGELPLKHPDPVDGARLFGQQQVARAVHESSLTSTLGQVAESLSGTDTHRARPRICLLSSDNASGYPPPAAWTRYLGAR